MYEIIVNLRPPTEIGRIHYYDDPDINKSILFITSSVRRFNINSINFQGGQAIIVFDKDHLLKDVECIYPRNAWEISETLFFPEPEIHVDIELTSVKSDQGGLIQPTLKKRKGIYFYSWNDEDTEVKILTDHFFSIAWIILGKHVRSGD
jgi:hypothetical protein